MRHWAWGMAKRVAVEGSDIFFAGVTAETSVM